MMDSSLLMTHLLKENYKCSTEARKMSPHSLYDAFSNVLNTYWTQSVSLMTQMFV